MKLYVITILCIMVKKIQINGMNNQLSMFGCLSVITKS